MGPKDIRESDVLDVMALKENVSLPDLIVNVQDKDNNNDDDKIEIFVINTPENNVEVKTITTIEEGNELPQRDTTVGITYITETHSIILIQILPAFLIAGLGMVVAGLYFDYITTWEVFEVIPQLIILAPSLLGLKGNIEQTLASRLSTLANIGQLNWNRKALKIILRNLALIQVQATVVALLAGILSVIFDIKNFELSHCLLIISSGTSTACVASLLLGIITSAVIIAVKQCNINPDHIATPIAASLGDITALFFLSLFAQFFYTFIDHIYWLSPVILTIQISILPLWIYLAKRNEGAKEVLTHGWIPVIVAMFISTAAGAILNILVLKYDDLAVFQPLVNGIAGNLVAIQASKMATQLHREEIMGILPKDFRICMSPKKVFFSKLNMAIAARVLMLLVIPGHLFFAYIIAFIKSNPPYLSIEFLIFYLIPVFIQVGIVIYLAVVLTLIYWKRNKNPDNMTIPYLTAIADFLGVCFLGMTFLLLDLLGKSDVV